jgi:hypothetical protein
MPIPAGLYVEHLLNTHGPLSLFDLRQHAMAARFGLAGIDCGIADAERRGVVRRDGDVLRLV